MLRLLDGRNGRKKNFGGIIACGGVDFAWMQLSEFYHGLRDKGISVLCAKQLHTLS